MKFKNFIPNQQRLTLKNELLKCIDEIKSSSLNCKEFLLYLLNETVKKL